MFDTNTLIVITCPALHDDCETGGPGKPTIITYKREGRTWQRYWTGYDHKGRYIIDSHDWGCRGNPEHEVAWAQANGHAVSIN
jgi:hypothetical protein